MSSDSQSKWVKKIEELETQIYNSTKMDNNNLLEQIKTWFSGLTTPLKVGVSILGIILTLSLLNTVFRVISLLFSLAIIGVIVYFGYQFFSRQNNKM